MEVSRTRFETHLKGKTPPGCSLLPCVTPPPSSLNNLSLTHTRLWFAIVPKPVCFHQIATTTTTTTSPPPLPPILHTSDLALPIMPEHVSFHLIPTTTPTTNTNTNNITTSTKNTITITVTPILHTSDLALP